MSMSRAVNEYKSVNVSSSIASANSYELIQILIDGALNRLATAKGHIQRNEFEEKGAVINKAIGIISGLQNSLDLEQGGDLANNLNKLYDYMERRLFEANTNNDAAIVDEVSGLLREVREGWGGIKDEANAILAESDGDN